MLLDGCVNKGTTEVNSYEHQFFMQDYTCACSVNVYRGFGIKDLNRVEENTNCPAIIASMLPKLNQMIYVEQNGRYVILDWVF